MPTGLQHKYDVTKNGSGQKVDDAFVLRVGKDPAAWLAAWYYASMTFNIELANDMREWLLSKAPTAESLGDEGKLNEELLSKIDNMLATPNGLPPE